MGRAQLGHHKSTFYINTKGLLIRSFRINEILQTVVSPTICQRILMLSHHIYMAKHPGHRHIYITPRFKCCWPHKAADDKRIVNKSQSYVQKLPTYRHNHEFHLFQQLDLSNSSQRISLDRFLERRTTNNTYLHRGSLLQNTTCATYI